jgi:hypothetical protein
MALYQSTELHSPALAQCPHCDGYDLFMPPAPRGDDRATCRICCRTFAYAEVERHALASARRRLAERFPQLGQV